MNRKRNLIQLTLDGNRDNKRARNSQSHDIENNNDILQKVQSRAGVILRIVLKNFMCHSHFEVDFNKNVNFLIGRNGSGKSAIITALVVGLGGKASITNRGSNVKSFIKAGESRGSIEITLYNGGPMAYRGNEFGAKIIIIRSFSKDTSSYRIKGENGKVFGTTFKEVQNITEAFFIDVDNPVCILNQDMSRNFLNSTNPAQKYKFLMKGTKLDLLFQKYNDIVNNRKNAQRAKDSKQEEFDEFEKKIQIMKKKVEMARQAQQLQIRRSELEKEISWAKVIKAENDFATADKAVEQFKEKCNKIKENIGNKSSRMKAIQNNLEGLQRHMMELKEELSAKQQPRFALKETQDKFKEKLSVKKSIKQQIQSVVNRKRKDAANLERDIQENTKKQAEIEAQRETQLQRIADAKEKIRVIQSTIQVTENDLRQMTGGLDHKRDEENKLIHEIREADAKLAQLNGQLRSLRVDSNNALLIYGKEIPMVLREIEAAAAKFKKLPIGPVGRFIKLKDKRWSVAVEGLISAGILRSFLVDNSADYNILKNIFQKVYGKQHKPQIIISKFFSTMHNVAGKKTETAQGCIPFLDVLEFSSSEVANCVIDLKTVERFLLISDVNIAERIMSNAALVPRNCARGITIEGHEYYPEPNYRFYKSMIHRASYLQVSTRDLIKELEEEQLTVQAKKMRLQEDHKAIRNELKDLLKERGELEFKLTKLQRGLITINREIENLTDAIEPNTAYVNTLVEELKEVQAILEAKDVEAEETDKEIANLIVKIKDFDEKIAEMKNSVSSIAERVQETIDQMSVEKGKRDEIGINEKYQKEQLHTLERHTREAEETSLQKQMYLKDCEERAKLVCERIETDRAVGDIGSELEEVNRQIRHQDGCNAYELAKEFDSMQAIFKEKTEVFLALKRNLEEVHRQEKYRKKLYHYIKECKINQICTMFELVLSRRKFQGKLTVDHITKVLEMIVYPQEGDHNITSSANLSGGERSFSTIAFLHAIWQGMESPFYFLDEFDVFMDKVNRTISMDVLITHAKNRSESQYVFLTPQDIHTIKSTNDVTIHRLNDPVRKRSLSQV